MPATSVAGRRGFTLMVAVLVNSIIIVIGLGIYGIVFREFNLAVVSRESQAAFYAADTLAECVLYWDQKRDALGAHPELITNELTICDEHFGGDVKIAITPVEGYPVPLCFHPDTGTQKFTYKYTTQLDFESSKSLKQPSADITIDKEESCESGDPRSIFTKLTTNGYNNDTPGDTRRVERGLEVNY